MDRNMRERLLLQAHTAVPGAETDFEAVDGYAQKVFKCMNEAYDDNHVVDYEALRNDYTSLRVLRDEIFQQQVQAMSSMRVIGTEAAYA